ncbi:thioredoxin [Alkalinema pantanalense CENA528]|uniref:thioredoxin n=1 Tax=Alkalinema pantanalense TaxID=1620705 RepID=UPI003D6F2E2A
MAVKKQFRNLEELLSDSDIPVLVDFYAEWCGPCQLMAQVLEQVNAQTADRLKVVKINTETYPQLASQHRVTALPTVVLFKQGQPVHRIEGLVQAKQLLAQIQPFL